MRVEILPPETLPTKWIDYTCFDFIFVSWADLKMLAGDNPEAWRAIGDWLRSGPTLCVYGMELTAEEIGELESLVGCLPDETEDETRDPTTGWRQPQVENAIGMIGASHPESFMQDTVDEQEIAANAAAKPPASPPFLYRSAGRGRLVAMPGEEPFSAGPYGFSWLLNELNSRNWMWYLRHGMSLLRDNDDYWNWAVPGIGRAPVGVFLISITGFILVIGPLNYLLLRRYQRLYLLPVTVSGGAGLISLALFSYALLGDGLAVRVRVRSFTWLDQRAGHAVSWSRQSYYAGLAPSRGLEFPEDAAVYPLARYSLANGLPGRRPPQLVWSNGQHLRSGFLASRSTAQFLVIQSGSSRVKLAIDESQSGTTAPRIVNELGVHIDQLLMKDEHGRCFQAAGVGPNESCTLAATALAPATQQLQDAFRAHRRPSRRATVPQPYFGYVNYRYFNSVDSQQTRPSCQTGVLERSIARALAASRNPAAAQLRGPHPHGADGAAGSRPCAGAGQFSRRFRSLVTGGSIMTSNPPAIELRRLHRYFGETKAVRDVTFEVPRGEVFGFIGPNGAGKTTSMRILATLDIPTYGDAYVDGLSVVNDPDRVRRRMGFMPDYFGTYPNVNCREYLDFFARAYALRGRQRCEAVERAMQFTGVDELADKPLRGLSKGMKQRLCLGRALIHDPSVLILDEPAAGLDPRAHRTPRDDPPTRQGWENNPHQFAHSDRTGRNVRPRRDHRARPAARNGHGGGSAARSGHTQRCARAGSRQHSAPEDLAWSAQRRERHFRRRGTGPVSLPGEPRGTSRFAATDGRLRVPRRGIRSASAIARGRIPTRHWWSSAIDGVDDPRQVGSAGPCPQEPVVPAG